MQSITDVLRAVSILAFAMSTCAAQTTVPASGIIKTIAGDGATGDTGDGGQATSAAIQATSSAIDMAGNIYFTDYAYNSIRKVTRSTGVVTTIAGKGSSGDSGDGGPATSATLAGPEGVAVDGAGNVYVAETGGARIRKITASNGIISTVAGTGTCGFSGDGGPATSATLCGPGGVAVDGSGNIYIADLDNERVRKVTASNGIISTVAGNGTYGSSGDGGQATSAELGGAIGVGVDQAGNIYIATYADNRIRKVSTSGIISTLAGNGTGGYSGDGGAASSAEINQPNGISVDAAGNVYIADANNQRVRLVSASTGVITTVAGNGTKGYSGDGGAATSAELNGPVGVASDQAGNLYIADDFNGRVRVVGASPVTGFVNPRFVVLAVAYAPPGASSNVMYSNNTVFGTNTSLNNTLQSSASDTTTIGAKVSIFGTGPNATTTASSTFTQSEETSTSVAISASSTTSNEVRGPSSSAAGVNHAYDVIYVWVNPKISLTTTATTSKLIWNGYSYNALDDANEMEVIPLYLTWVQNPSTIPSDVAARLARSWDHTLGGLTNADYATIAARDPFTNNPGYNPATDSSARFDLTGNTTFTYEPPPAGGQPITQNYNLAYSTTSTAGQNAMDSYQTAFAVDTSASAGVNIGIFSATVTDDFKSSSTFTATNQWSNTNSTSGGQGAALSITGPASTDGYTGPTQIQVWKDNVYGTFMFYPVH